MRNLALTWFASATAAVAQVPSAPPVIRVMGHGVAHTAPDVARITFGLRGEGTTSDDAVRALVARRDAIEAALAGKAEWRTGKLTIATARDKACDSADEDDGKPRLSTGVCAIRGYVATLDVTVKVTRVDDAGTLLGLASRLGATDPSLDDFDLLHPEAARRAAIADAMRDAREQAEAIASASHVTLGKLRRVEDQRAGGLAESDIVVTGQRLQAPAPPPIAVRLSPAPIETRADLLVEFDLGGTR